MNLVRAVAATKVLPGEDGAVSRKALLLFLGASLIWGSSFLLIRVAVRGISPAALVLGRTVTLRDSWAKPQR